MIILLLIALVVSTPQTICETPNVAVSVLGVTVKNADTSPAQSSLTPQRDTSVLASNELVPIEAPTLQGLTYYERKARAIEKRKQKLAKKGLLATPKRLSFMNYEELVAAKNKRLKARDYRSAIRYCEQILKVVPDTNSYMYHMIELADLFFITDAITKAQGLYESFSKLHGGHPLAEYTGIKSIICALKQTRPNDRDQTQTAFAIALTDQFLSHSSTYQTYTSLAEAIRHLCCLKLIASEINIIAFLMKQNNTLAARKRLTSVHETWFDKVPELTAQYTVLDNALQKYESGAPDSSTTEFQNFYYTLGTETQKQELLTRVEPLIPSLLTSA